MDFPAMAEDVRQFMDDHDLARAHVMGHSMGGKTAMQFAVQHPGRVDRMIVVDIAPRAYERAHDHLIDALMGIHLPSFEKRSEIEQWLEPVIPSLAVRRFLLKNLARNPDGGFHWKFNLPALQENYPALAGPVEIMHPCLTPTLFIRGGESDYIAESDIEEIALRFPRSVLRTIPGASHWLLGDAPDAVAQLVQEFLREEAGARG
jgi:pimeloyl-ACP methyl ester carboxylesterase